MKCPKCKNDNRLMAHYCSQCGAALNLPFYFKWWFWLIIFLASAYSTVTIFSFIFIIFIVIIVINVKYRNDQKHPTFNRAVSSVQNEINLSGNSTSEEVVRSVLNVNTVQADLDSIQHHFIELSHYEHEPEKYKKIKPTNITVRSNLDNLGTFIVLDTETTGISPFKDKIIELAAIKFENWIPTEIFQTLINPQQPIPAAASNVNNITDDMVKDAPLISDVMNDFNSFIKSFNIVGHNLDFDLEFLVSEGAIFNSRTKYYDTLWLAKKVLNSPSTKVWNNELGQQEYISSDDVDVENYKLSTIADYYDIGDSSKAHRAAYDAYVTGLIFKNLATAKNQGKE